MTECTESMDTLTATEEQRMSYIVRYQFADDPGMEHEREFPDLESAKEFECSLYLAPLLDWCELSDENGEME